MLTDTVRRSSLTFASMTYRYVGSAAVGGRYVVMAPHGLISAALYDVLNDSIVDIGQVYTQYFTFWGAVAVGNKVVMVPCRTQDGLNGSYVTVVELVP